MGGIFVKKGGVIKTEKTFKGADFMISKCAAEGK